MYFLEHLLCYLLNLQPTTCRPNIKTLTMENFRTHYRHQSPAFRTINPVFLDMWPSTFALLRSENSHHIATTLPQGVGLDSTPPHGLEWGIWSSVYQEQRFCIVLPYNECAHYVTYLCLHVGDVTLTCVERPFVASLRSHHCSWARKKPLDESGLIASFQFDF